MLPENFSPVVAWYFLSALSFGLGLCIGSFANVCICRMPLGRSVVAPRSHCPRCSCPIAWYDNIPLLSFVVLRGRCRSCAGKISPRYFAVELITGAIFFLLWLFYGLSWLTLAYWLMAGGLVIGTFIDLEHMIIPDQITIGGIFAGLILSGLFPQLHGTLSHSDALRSSFIGMMTGGITLWIVGELGRIAFKKDAMGLGDVKLLAALGAFLGWQAVWFIILVASLTGAAAGIAMIWLGNKTMASRIPFGPYIAFSALLWVLGGRLWWGAYFDWVTQAPFAGG